MNPTIDWTHVRNFASYVCVIVPDARYFNITVAGLW